jgi:DNA-binding NarL/FixJ family response regulator
VTEQGGRGDAPRGSDHHDAGAVAPGTPRTRLVIVDDDALVRAGLRLMLDGAHGIEVVGEAADGAEVAAVLDAHPTDVVLMDLRMPRVDGIEATRRVRARPDAPAVVVLTTFDTDEEVVGALHAGASGYLLKDMPPERIVAPCARPRRVSPCCHRRSRGVS